VNPKAPAKGTKTTVGTKSPVQQSKIIESSLKQPRMETFSIGDSSEHSKMVIKEDSIEESGRADLSERATDASGDNVGADVNHEDPSSIDSEDNYPPTV